MAKVLFLPERNNLAELANAVLRWINASGAMADTCSSTAAQKRQTEERIGSRQFSSPARAFRHEGNAMMTRRQANAGILASAALAAAPAVVVAQELKPKDLPPPRSEGGQSLTAALKLRRSTREYSDRPLPAQVLSDLLWAAFGVNRPASDGRTVPYWRHIMVIDVYLAMADGVWLYEPKTHKLLPYMKEDFRAQTGLQDFVATAPLNLVYIAHGERMTDVTPEERRLYACADACFIGQNVYLFCASEGLATVFRGAVDGPKLEQHLRLPDQQFVTFAQTVGYPRG